MAAGSHVGDHDFDATPFCVESQEWTYGIDNTGTTFADEATYTLTLSDGTSISWDQTPTASWTPQMAGLPAPGYIGWAAALQQAADDAGLKWQVDVRFRDPSDPSDLAGIGPSAGGPAIPGPPSEIVSVGLTNMLWRYLNIQICPGQPVPVAAEITSSITGREGKLLTTDGPILGPLQKFEVCKSCEKDIVTSKWFIYDADADGGIREAELGEIPFCWEPCGVIAALPAPPSSDCEFEFDTACDNNLETDPVNFTNLITRRVTYCNGRKVGVEYYKEDPADPTALEDYELVGEYVDCASGERVPLPPPPCENASYAGQVWRVLPNAVLETTVDWWGGANSANPTSAPHGNVSTIFTVSGDGSTLEHGNGAPTATFTTPETNIATSAAFFYTGVGEPNNAATNGTDQLRVRGYIILNSPVRIRDTNPNTGERGGIWLNKCCAGSLELLFEDTTDSVGGDTSIFDGVRLPAGRHYVEIVTSDLSAWQGFELSASFDDGATYAPLPLYSTKPAYECITLIRCNDTGTLLNRDTGEVYTPNADDLSCEPPACIADEAEAAFVDPTATTLCDESEGYKVEGTKFPIQYHAVAGKTTGLRNREWFDLGPANAFGSDPTPVEAFLETFNPDDPALPPDLDAPIAVNVFALNDTSNTASILDYQRRDGFICLSAPLTIEFGTTSEGYVALWIGQCGGPQQRVISFAKSVGNERTPRVTIPAGIHSVRLDNVDWGGSNSSWTVYNVIGGVPVADNNLFDPFSSLSPPYWECLDGWICGDQYQTLTGDPLVFDDATVRCKPDCVPLPAPAESATGGVTDNEALAQAIVDAQRNVTPRMMNFTNEGGVESLTDAAGNPYPAGTFGRIDSVEDIGTGFVRWSIDGSVPTTQEGTGFTSTGPYHYYALENVDLSLVRLDGSSANSDYSITFVEYN